MSRGRIITVLGGISGIMFLAIGWALFTTSLAQASANCTDGCGTYDDGHCNSSATGSCLGCVGAIGSCGADYVEGLGAATHGSAQGDKEIEWVSVDCKQNYSCEKLSQGVGGCVYVAGVGSACNPNGMGVCYPCQTNKGTTITSEDCHEKDCP